MAEYVLGFDLDDDSLPWRLAFSDSDTTESRLLVRYRKYPGWDKWLLVVAHRIETKSGWLLDVSLPTHVMGGWQTLGGDWRVYTGVRWTGREYPVEWLERRAWMDGYAAARLVGVRREIVRPLYLALEGGVQREVLRVMDEDGGELEAHETEFAPWARLSLETWLTTP